MASRRSHAPSHSRTSISSRVPRGHVSVRNPLQAPKERSCGISITLSPSWFRKAGPTIILNIIRDALVPLRGTISGWKYRTYPQRRCFAACSGFHDIGPASRNPQLILNLLVFVGAASRSSYSISLCSWVQPPTAHTQLACVRGCVATARRHSLLCLHCKLTRYSPAMYHPPMFASIVAIIILIIFHACCLCPLLLS